VIRSVSPLGTTKAYGTVVFATAVARAALFANIAILARIFSAEDLGIYSTAWTAINVFLTFSLFGLHTATAKTVSESLVQRRDRIGKIFFNAIAIAAVFGVILFVSTLALGPAVERFTRTPGFGTTLKIVGWNLPFLNVAMVAQAVLQGMHEFPSYSLLAATPGLITIPVTYAFAAGAGLSGALWATVAVNIVSMTVSLVFVARTLQKRKTEVEFAIDRTVLRRLLSLSLPLFLGGALVLPAWWLASLYFARTDGFVAVGMFVPALTFFQWLQFLPGALNVPTLSFLTSRIAEGNRQGFETILNRNFRVVCLVTIPIVLTVWAVRSSILQCVFGARFADAGGALGWMGWAGLLSGSSLVFASALISAGRVWTTLFVNLFWVCLFLSLMAILAPLNGGAGIAEAAFISYLLYSALLWFVVGRASIPARLVSRIVVFSILSAGLLHILVGGNVHNTTCAQTVLSTGAIGSATLLVACFTLFSWQELQAGAALFGVERSSNK
jgi:O-antigen/teichoic acid export membrane protein